MTSDYPSEEDRCADLIIFLFAGHDTTGCALAWTILEVSKNPTILANIRQELDVVNPDRNKPFDKSHLSKLEYLWNVIRESFRLWPVTAVAGLRQLNQDILFKNMCLPKNSSVHISNFTIHRSNITRPDDFIPERWGEVSTITHSIDKSILEFRDKEIDILNNQNLIFSLGKRNCVGQNMAVIEMKLILATILRSYEFQSCPTPDLSTSTATSSISENAWDSNCHIGSVDYEYYITMKPRNCYLKINSRL